MAGNPTFIETMVKEHEKHVMEDFKTIDHLANKHNIKHTLERLHRSPGEAIVKAAAKQDVDLIIAGSRGHGTVRRTIMGSVSDYIVHHSHIPVIICKHEDEHHKLSPKYTNPGHCASMDVNIYPFGYVHQYLHQVIFIDVHVHGKQMISFG